MAAAKGETRAENALFDLISIRCKDLHLMRRRCGKPAANRWRRMIGSKMHAAGSGFLRGDGMAGERFVAAADAMQLRKIFRRKAARR
jgi:hypothetical protein